MDYAAEAVRKLESSENASDIQVASLLSAQALVYAVLAVGYELNGRDK